MDDCAARKKRVELILSQLTLEEKASLTSGVSMFDTQEIERLKVPSITMTDGPHGLRKQEGEQDFMGKNESITATCFPAACAVGSSFDKQLVSEMGHALGEICQAKDVQVLLGPGINIKRNPLCGRNFEYFSEDPCVSGTMGTAYVKSLQENGVGASLKHFLANNQETRRRTSDSRLSERTLREIYTPAFEQVVKEAKPWTLMASYNKIDGTYATENGDYLQDLLRKEWGFEGLVESDWAAVHDRIKVLQGGCALTMPGDKAHDQVVVQAVKDGILKEEVLDENVAQILDLVLKAEENKIPEVTYDFEAAHQLAKKVAQESMVLLKNQDNLLPLDQTKNIVIIGAFAKDPRYQGAGSSRVNPYKVPALPEVTEGLENVTYVQGFDLNDEMNPDMVSEAVTAAKEADIAIIMAGLPPMMESEGFDRWVMKLPKVQNHVIHQVCQAQPNTVVVLENGGALEMPWNDEPKAILEAYLSGEAASEAIWSVLTGEVNPSGHLAETFPMRLEDNPSYLFWPGEEDVTYYPEGVFVGYRYYTSKNIPVRYSFGHGLSYTDFTYSNLIVENETAFPKEETNQEGVTFASGEKLTASVTVTNTGKRAGKALVQLYIGCARGATVARRPVRELRRFAKVALQPGESKTVTFTLDDRCFSYWDEEVHAFRVAGGDYTVEICQDAATVLLSEKVTAANQYLPTGRIYSIMTPAMDVMKHPLGKEFIDGVMPMINAIIKKMGMNDAQSKMPYFDEAPKDMGLMAEPMQTMKRMLPNISEEQWNELFEKLNA